MLQRFALQFNIIFTIFNCLGSCTSLFQNKWKNLTFDDSELLEFAKRHINKLPGYDKPYNLTLIHADLYSKSFREQWKSSSWYFINKVLKLLYDDQRRPGIYVDLGALDGEYQSNSLYLETELQWTGLLVEPNKAMFRLLVNKNRKALTSNLCIGKENHSYQDILQYELPSVIKRVVVRIPIYSIGYLMNSYKLMPFKRLGQLHYQSVTCVPLITLLKALKEPKIDIVMMNINGLESEVLNKFPLGNFPVDVWIVRNLNQYPPYPPEAFDVKFIERFASKGYALFAIGYDKMDYIFIHFDSPIFEKSFRKRPKNWSVMVDSFEYLYPIVKN